MPRVSFNRLSKKKSSTRRRRVSTLTRTRYAAPSRYRNKRLAVSNALAIAAIKRVQPQPALCDWINNGTLFADVADSPAFTSTMLSAQLMSPNLWAPCLRQDANVSEASGTLVKRIQVSLRYALQDSNWAQISLFIVTFRKDAANRTINSLVEPADFVQNPQDFNTTLSSAVTKVHFVRHLSLSKGNFLDPNPVEVGGRTFVGQPGLTFSKGQVTLNLNFKIRSPPGAAWVDMNQDQFQPYRRYQLLAFITQQSNNVTAQSGCRIDYSSIATTMNHG